MRPYKLPTYTILRYLTLLIAISIAMPAYSIATKNGGGIIDDVPGGLPLILHDEQLKSNSSGDPRNLIDDNVNTVWTTSVTPNLATESETLPTSVHVNGIGDFDCGYIQMDLKNSCKESSTLAIKLVNCNDQNKHITKLRILISADESLWSSLTINGHSTIDFTTGGRYDADNNYIVNNSDLNQRVTCFSIKVPNNTRYLRLYPVEVSGATKKNGRYQGDFSLSELQVYEMLKPGEAGVRSLVLPDKNSDGNVIQVSVPYGEVYVNDNKINGHSNNTQYLANATTNLPTEKIHVEGMGDMEFAHIKIDLNGTYSNVPIVIKKENRSDNSRGNFTKVRILTSDQESINGTWVDRGIFGSILYDQAGNIVLADNINPKDGLVSTYTFTPTEDTRYIRMYPIEVAGMKKGQYNLISGGDAESGQTASVIQQFDYANNTEIQASVIEESGNHFFKIPITANPAYDWSSQMLIVANENIYLGDRVKLSFKYKCDDDRTIQLQTHTTQGAYCGGIDNIKVATIWQEFSREFDVTSSITNKGWFKHLAFNLSTKKDVAASNFYIDDIKFEIVGLAEIRGGNAESGESENIKGETNGSNNMTVDYDHVFKVKVLDAIPLENGAYPVWDTGAFIKWDSNGLNNGDYIRISFRYSSEDREEDSRPITVWAGDENVVRYWSFASLKNAYTTWQSCEAILSYDDLKFTQDGVNYIVNNVSLRLASKSKGTNFYMDDIHIDKVTVDENKKVKEVLSSLMPNGDAENLNSTITKTEYPYFYVESKNNLSGDPEIVPDPLHYSKVFRFSIPSKADAPNSWTSQAYIMPTIPFVQGQLTLSFDYRCEDERSIPLKRHGQGGDYTKVIAWDPIATINATPQWQHYEFSYNVIEETNPTDIFNAISFWLSTGTYASNFYLDNVALDYNPKRSIVPTTERFLIEGGDAENGKTDQVIDHNGQALEIDPPANNVFSRDIDANSNPSDSWRTQLFIKSDRTLKEGDKVTISFRYKCDDNRNISLSTQGAIGDYHADIYYNDENNISQRLKAATPEWQTYSTEFTVSAEQAGDPVENKTYGSDRHSENDGFNYVAIDLASATNASKFYIDDIVFNSGDDSVHPNTYRRDFMFGDLKVYVPVGHSAAASLIINADQLTTNAGSSGSRSSALLLDGELYNGNTFNTFISGSDCTKHYLQVDLKGAVYWNDRLSLLIRRDFHDTKAIPVKFRVEGCEDASVTETSVWTTSAFIDLPYTTNDDELKWQSATFLAGGTFRHLRFIPVLWYDGNAGTSTASDKAGIALAEFRLYIEDSQKGINNVIESNLTGDVKYAFLPVYGSSDSHERAKNATFSHTHGIIDPRNHSTLALREWCDWDNWNDIGTWNYAESTPDKYKKMPDFSYLNETVDLDGKQVRLEGDRQQAPTLVHEIYALPGQYVHLRPFSDIRKNEGISYCQKYIRWYDFKTDKICEGLSFPMDYAKNHNGKSLYEDIIENKNGHFAGISFPSIQRSSKHYDGRKVETMGELTGTMATYHVPNDSEFEDKWIAVDFAQESSMRVGYNYDLNIETGNDVIYEPALSFRHIFHIKDAREFAKEFGYDAKTNGEYVKSHRREVTARANADFQMRLDGTPSYCNEALGQKPYYKNGKVEFVHSFVIKTYKTDGNVIPENDTVFYIKDDAKFDDLEYTLYDAPDADGKLPEHKAYTYARGFACNQDKAKEGVYIVRIEGLDENGNPIKFGNGSPLILQEYEVTFVCPEKASLLIESEMDKHKTHTNAYLERVHGKKAQAVDFDDYKDMMTVGGDKGVDLNNYFSADHIMTEWNQKSLINNIDRLMERINNEDPEYDKMRFKWPLPWDQTNYAFQYAHTFDFNVYSITNNLEIAPYNAGSCGDKNEENEIGTGKKYDRLHENDNSQYGYMFYVNAAADPGVIAEIEINKICTGSTLHVTGWLNEQTGGVKANGTKNNYPEAANLIISFKVKNKTTKEEKILHSFVTGPTEKRGNWYQFYYEINLTKLGISSNSEDNIYSVVFENNAMSSMGADYCVDDLRVYVTAPLVYASQVIPVCNGAKHTDIRIETPFESILASMSGEKEAETENDGKDLLFYYSFLDKAKYENKINEGKDYSEAFNAAIVGHYNSDNKKFGKIRFNTYFEANNGENGFANGIPDKSEERWLTFDTHPEDDNMEVGKEYIMTLYSADTDMDEDFNDVNKIAYLYDINDDCSKKCFFTVAGSGTIRVDGVVQDVNGEVNVCAGQSPVIKVDLQNPENGAVFEKSLYDWYNGPLTSKEGYDYCYDNEKYSNDLTLKMALTTFREEYPTAVSLEGVVPCSHPTAANEHLTQEMIDYLKEMTTPDEKGFVKLILCKSSYVIDRIGEETKDIYVTAIPIDIYSIYGQEDGNVVFCSDAAEVHLKVTGSSPDINHGFKSESIIYPMDDVPLRIGLGQISKAATEKKSLIIPIRSITLASSSSQQMKLSEDRAIYLAESDDPEALAGVDNSEIGLPIVGYINNITATIDDKDEDEIEVKFIDFSFFREGYSYRLKFNFREDINSSETEMVPCDGQHVFTIKIVPEYQRWTGRDSRNWANDDNWERVSSLDLKYDYIGSDKGKYADKANDDRVIDGTNGNKHSYAPLDFTKVIIPSADDVTPPYLYPIANVTKSEKLIYKGKEFDFYNTPVDGNSGIATENIQYDMAAFEHTYNDKNDIHCRPWYTQNVEQTHFNSGSQLANQQHLTYNKAWAEIEVTPATWHTLSSPLQRTYAGDLYLPTANARQETPLFNDIYFDNSLKINNRFAPAVFQMLWNERGSATVYKKDGNYETAAVYSTWSNVYNDVKDDYSGGNAFAINVDMDGVTNPLDKALFRLPKADTSYTYYDQEGNSGSKVDDSVNKDNMGRLNPTEGDISVHVDGGSKYFMVGNPFISMMDMGKFLDKNSNTVEKKFYLINGDGYYSVSWDGSNIVTNLDEEKDATDANDALANALKSGYIPPFTSVFLEAKDTSVKSLHYDETMNTEYPKNARATRSSDWGNLYISAIRGGRSESTALLVQDNMADPEYNTAEDMMLLVDEELRSDMAHVFTSSSGMAISINMVPEGTTVGVGLLAPHNAETTLVFSGDCTGLSLLDTESNTLEPLFDGYELTVEGSTDGRYFINAGIAEYPEDAIKVMTEGHKLIVFAPGPDDMKVSIYDVSGITVVSDITDEPQWETILNDGVYVVEAVKNGCRVVRKIIV